MKKIVLFVLTITCSVGLLGQSSITLNDCIAQAEQHSPQANLLPIIQKATDLQTVLLQKNYLPQSSASGQATWQSATTSLPIQLPGVDVVPLSKFQYKATVDVTQSIWDGGVTKQQQIIARAGALAETEKVKTDLYSLREQVSTLFFGVVLADKQIENAALLRKDLEAKIAKAKNLKAGGLAIGNNILALDARLIELEQQVNDALSRKDAALQALALLTNNTNIKNSPFTLDADLPIPDTTSLNRPELSYFKAQSDAISASERLIKAKNMPKIGAFATAGVGRPSLNFLLNDVQPYFIAGVQLRAPLTHLYSKSPNIERQQLLVNKEKIAQQEKNFIWLTKVKAASQHQDIERFDNLLANDRKLIAIRQQMLETADVQLENGIITTNDYLTEANNVDLARQNLIFHQIQRLQAINALAITVGK